MERLTNSFENVMEIIRCNNGKMSPNKVAIQVLMGSMAYARKTTKSTCQTPSAITRLVSILSGKLGLGSGVEELKGREAATKEVQKKRMP